MPVTGTPTTQPVLTRDAIRMLMRDYVGRVPNTGDLNVLLDNVKFSDAEYDNAIAFTVDRYNGLPPSTALTADQINRYTLVVGVMCLLLNSESVRQACQQADVTDANVPQVGLEGKAALFAQIADRACAEFKEMAREQKTAANMNGAWGAVGSGYARRIRWR